MPHLVPDTFEALRHRWRKSRRACSGQDGHRLIQKPVPHMMSAVKPSSSPGSFLPSAGSTIRWQGRRTSGDPHNPPPNTSAYKWHLSAPFTALARTSPVSCLTRRGWKHGWSPRDSLSPCLQHRLWAAAGRAEEPGVQQVDSSCRGRGGRGSQGPPFMGSRGTLHGQRMEAPLNLYV